MIMCLSNVNGAVTVGMLGMRGRMFLSVRLVGLAQRALFILAMVTGVSRGVACLTRMRLLLSMMMGTLFSLVGVSVGTLIASTKRM